MLNFSREIVKSGIARRLIIYVVLFSSLITLLTTAMQLYRDYNNDIDLIEDQLQQIQDVHLKSLTATLWASDSKELRTHLEGISRLRDMQFLEVRDRKEVWVSLGAPQSRNVMSSQYPMIYTHRGRDIEIGTLTIVASLTGVYQRLIDRVWVILISNAVKTFLVAGFILIIFHILITRHLIRIADFAHTLDINRLDRQLGLDRKGYRKHKTDELDLVVNAINQMQVNIKEAFTALDQSEGRLQILAKVSPVGIFRTDALGNCIYVNERWCELAGMREAEALGEGWIRALHPEDRERVLSEWSQAAVDNMPFQSECRFQHPSGKVTWLLALAEAELDVGGQVVGYVGTITDITERKTVEMAALRRYAAMQKLDHWVRKLITPHIPLHTFYGIICDGIRDLVDADLGALPLINTDGTSFTYVAVTGAKAGMMKGQTLPVKGGGLCGWVAEHGQPLLAPSLANDPRVIQNLAEALDATTGVLTPLTREDRVIGGLSAFRKGKPFDEFDEEILILFGHRVSATLENINLLATLEEQVGVRTVELAAANKELEAFSYSVSHDLRAPLRAIDGFSKAVLEDYADKLDAEGRDHLQRVRRGAQRMGGLIDNLLMLSQVSRAEMHRKKVDLSALTAAVLGRLEQSEPDRKVDQIVASGVNVEGDSQLLEIVMDNLLGNAWKYTGKTESPRIEFGVTEQDGETAYFVKDNGVGFNMKYAAKLFGPFQRLHKEEDFTGTGVGLATVLRIVHRHGGRIWAEAEEGKGATIYFTLHKA